MNITRSMCRIGKHLACLAIALFCTTSIARAALTVSVEQTFFTTVPGVTTLTFDAVSAPTVPPNTIAFADGTIDFEPDAKVVNGAASGLYAAPWNFSTNAADATNYITSGSTGNFANAAVTFNFDEDMNYFGLLWGSIDAYNTLSFFDGNTLVGTVTSALFPVLAPATGLQDANGTLYVNIDSDLAFNKVIATSSQYAFEFDNVAYTPVSNIGEVPEPASLAIWGLGALGLATLRARRKLLLG